MSYSIKFSDYKEKIMEAINKPEWIKSSGINELTSLNENFVFLDVQEEISDTMDFYTAKSLKCPCISLIGYKSGRVYLFSVASIIPGYTKQRIKTS